MSVISDIVGTFRSTFAIGNPATGRGTLSASSVTGSKTFTLPNNTGTVALTLDFANIQAFAAAYG